MEINNKDDLGLVMACAFCYALGRKSYSVAVVANFIVNNKSFLSTGILELMIQEIKRAEAQNELGMDMDKEYWNSVNEILMLEYKNRQKE